MKLPGNPGLSTLEAGNRAVLAQRADLVKQIPQFVPVTSPFPPQIPPLEGDLSERFRYNELTHFQTGNRLSPFGARGDVRMTPHPAQMLCAQNLVGIAC